MSNFRRLRLCGALLALAQLAGGAAATVVFGWLYPRAPAVQVPISAGANW